MVGHVIEDGPEVGKGVTIFLESLYFHLTFHIHAKHSAERHQVFDSQVTSGWVMHSIRHCSRMLYPKTSTDIL